MGRFERPRTLKPPALPGDIYSITISVLATQDAEECAFVEDGNTIGEVQKLLDFAGKIEHCTTVGGIATKLFVELDLRAKIDASRWIIQHDDGRGPCESSTDQHLLLVSAAQRGDKVR